MKNIITLLMVLLLFSSCEKYVTERKDLTLSGKYVVSRLDVTNVDQNQSRDSLYTLGSTYSNNLLPPPFDNIKINRFYIHLDYSTIRFGFKGVTYDGRDIWQYGASPNEIFYNVIMTTSYRNGYIQFTYVSSTGITQTMTFLIEDDGFETLQLKSSGAWFDGKFGQKQVITLYLTRTGP